MGALVTNFFSLMKLGFAAIPLNIFYITIPCIACIAIIKVVRSL